MRSKFAVSSLVLAPFLLSVVCIRPVAAQVNVQVQIAVPTIRFQTAPVLVEVSPGVQVVEDYDQEVFFVDDWYWYRSGPTWYRTRDHRGGWVVVHDRSVPPTLVRIPPGRYKHYRGNGRHMNEQRRERMPQGREVQLRRNDDSGRQERKEHKEHKENKEHKEHKHGHR
jgi:hypothetical protein